jgi:hypothetical protein
VTAASAPLSDRVAARVFAGLAALSWLVLVFKWGQGRWFGRDDWNFLAGRDGGDLWSLFEGHGEHLSVVPVIIYRVLFNLFGLRFGPYLALVVSMHIVVAVLLRLVMRRVDVQPWVATVAAGSFLLFGRGEENILWAFQISFIGSLAFGLAQLLLADHSGPIGRRDAAALVCGALSIGSSGVGPVMVVAVGAICLLRRGERPAMFQTLPLAVAYVSWLLIIDPRGPELTRPPLRTSLDWARHGLTEPIRGFTLNPVLAVVLGLLLVGGLVLAIASAAWTFWRRFAAPLVLLACAPLFYGIVAQGRWIWGLRFTGSGRYVYIAAALMLPAIGLAADAIVKRFPMSLPVVLLVLLAGVPANIDRFDNDPVFNSAYYDRERQTLLGIAHSPLIDSADAWIRPEPESFKGPDLDVGWLRQARADGRVPDPGPIDPAISAQFPLRLALAQHEIEGTAPLEFCETHPWPLDLSLRRGDAVRIYSDVFVAQLLNGEPSSSPVVFRLADGNGVLSVEVDQLDIRISSAGNQPVAACAIG